LVEDDLAAARIVARTLGRVYDVTLAENGEQGLACASAMRELDLIITDVTMPRLDGITMVTRIREIESRRWTPVVFLTGRTDPKDIIRGIQSGARHYLTKPVDLDALERKVHKVLKTPWRMPARYRSP
jgi:DNA-binding response OmpR family regulator